MEEVWLERFPGEGSSIHLVDMPETPNDWLDAELAEKWTKVRSARRVVTAALEVERTNKVIGASLEAAPVVYVTDADVLAALTSVEFEDVCITSAISVVEGEGLEGAFTLPEIDGVAVVFAKAEGNKCQRSWKILPEVGTDADFPDVTMRDADALRELRAEGLI